MEVITKYKAVDGVEFYEEQQCADYETLISKTDRIMGSLKLIPDHDSGFGNGKYYIQQTKDSFLIVRKELLELTKTFITHEWVKQSIDDESMSLSYVARLVDDGNIRPLNSAFYRLACIDSSFKEWGQPYYANNPESDAKEYILR